MDIYEYMYSEIVVLLFFPFFFFLVSIEFRWIIPVRSGKRKRTPFKFTQRIAH